MYLFRLTNDIGRTSFTISKVFSVPYFSFVARLLPVDTNSVGEQQENKFM